MIPKKIHYCWFGGKPLPDDAVTCIKSWKRYCPDYEIIEWNEKNFGVEENEYAKEAYEAKKWAFVSDYARLKIIYDNGGIYLDIDVEVIRPLDALTADGTGFIGFQNAMEIATGLGFAAEAENVCIKEMLAVYKNRHFRNRNGEYDLTPCPVVNTVALKNCGLKTGIKASRNIQVLDGMKVLPISYLNPLNSETTRTVITKQTFTIHHYAASWNTEKQKRIRKLKKIIPGFVLNLRVLYLAKRDVYLMEKEIKGRENVAKVNSINSNL